MCIDLTNNQTKNMNNKKKSLKLKTKWLIQIEKKCLIVFVYQKALILESINILLTTK